MNVNDSKRSLLYRMLLPLLFILPQCRAYTPRTYNPNAHGSDAYRESIRLCIGTLYRYKCRLPSETIQNRTQTKDTTPPGIEIGPPGWKTGTLPTTTRRWTMLFIAVNSIVLSCADLWSHILYVGYFFQGPMGRDSKTTVKIRNTLIPSEVAQW